MAGARSGPLTSFRRPLRLSRQPRAFPTRLHRRVGCSGLFVRHRLLHDVGASFSAALLRPRTFSRTRFECEFPCCHTASSVLRAFVIVGLERRDRFVDLLARAAASAPQPASPQIAPADVVPALRAARDGRWHQTFRSSRAAERQQCLHLFPVQSHPAANLRAIDRVRDSTIACRQSTWPGPPPVAPQAVMECPTAALEAHVCIRMSRCIAKCCLDAVPRPSWQRSGNGSGSSRQASPNSSHRAALLTALGRPGRMAECH